MAGISRRQGNTRPDGPQSGRTTERARYQKARESPIARVSMLNRHAEPSSHELHCSPAPYHPAIGRLPHLKRTPVTGGNMPLRRLLILSACLGVLPAAAAMACPDHGEKTAVVSKSRPASAAAVVAWKPRAWAPPAPAGAAGLRVEIDPVDGAMGMPAPDL